jgi:hypothetical protein
MNQTKSALAPQKPLSTERRDIWWLEPALVAIGFGLFIIYATWRAFENNFYEIGPYLSPFYSPKIVLDWWKFSPALLILWVPAGFRATCYYYRKAYYRAYFLSPPACGVGGINALGLSQGKKYCGESTFPLVIQNIHRYMLYLAIAVLGFLWYDAILACIWQNQLRIGVGSIIFIANCLFLSAYTFGCHVFRHLVGGKLDCFSCSQTAKTQFSLWEAVTKFNEHHMFWAWVSLFSVAITDFYVRLIASHSISDLTLIGPPL